VRHITECPVRWADMDMLQHVNNVTYVDYLQEARIDMFMSHAEFHGGEELAEGVVVVRHELEFAAPLTFRSRPVMVDSWITQIRAGSFTMAYEVYDEVPSDDGDAGRQVYVRASSLLAPFVFATERPRRISEVEREVLGRYLTPAEPREPIAGAGGSRYVHPLRVRWSDVDAYRHVNNVKYVEYFQEARLRYLMHLHQDGDEFGEIVVARTDVDYKRPLFFRLEPYEVHSWVSHVGRSSFVIAAEIRDPSAADGDQLLATSRSVLVGFDRTTQRAAPLPPDQRIRLLEQVDTP
jgi:acyl-CoA thioester hydrolase